MWLIDQLKRLDVNGLQLDEAVALSAQAKQVRAEFEARQIDTPVWLDGAIHSLNREIEIRRADALAKRLTDLRRQQDALKTPEERRAGIADEIARLESQLAAVK